MLKHLAIFAVAVFVLAAAPSVQAAPAAGLLSLKTSQSVVEPVYWRYHHYRYWRHRVYWRQLLASPLLLAPPCLLPSLSLLGTDLSPSWLVLVSQRGDNCQSLNGSKARPECRASFDKRPRTSEQALLTLR